MKGNKELLGLSDSHGVPLREGDTVTNGKVKFIIEWNAGFFAYVCYRNLFKTEMTFLHELAKVIETKYLKV